MKRHKNTPLVLGVSKENTIKNSDFPPLSKMLEMSKGKINPDIDRLLSLYKDGGKEEKGMETFVMLYNEPANKRSIQFLIQLFEENIVNFEQWQAIKGAFERKKAVEHEIKKTNKDILQLKANLKNSDDKLVETGKEFKEELNRMEISAKSIPEKTEKVKHESDVFKEKLDNMLTYIENDASLKLLYENLDATSIKELYGIYIELERSITSSRSLKNIYRDSGNTHELQLKLNTLKEEIEVNKENLETPRKKTFNQEKGDIISLLKLQKRALNDDLSLNSELLKLTISLEELLEAYNLSMGWREKKSNIQESQKCLKKEREALLRKRRELKNKILSLKNENENNDLEKFKQAFLNKYSDVRVDILKMFLRLACEKSIIQSPQDTLLLACSQGDLESVEILLNRKDIDVNHQTEDGETPLVFACKNGHLEIVKVLLKKNGIDLNLKDEYGVTALLIACEGNYLEIVKELLALLNEDAINAQDTKYGKTGLIHAYDHGNFDIVNALLENKYINVNVRDNNGGTIFKGACEDGHEEIVKRLLSREELNINAEMEVGTTGFMLACQNGHKHVVEILLPWMIKQGDINRKSKLGSTALHMACAGGHWDIVNLLLTIKGIDVTIKTPTDKTAFDLVCEAFDLACKDDNKDVVQILRGLLNAGSEVDFWGSTWLLLRGLLNAGSEVGFWGFTWLCEGGHNKVVESLLPYLKAGSEPVVNGFMLACQNGHKHVVESLLPLLKQGDINRKSKLGSTALHMACHNGHLDIVNLLLTRRDIDITIKTPKGFTALDIATSRRHNDIKILLESKASDSQSLEPEEKELTTELSNTSAQTCSSFRFFPEASHQTVTQENDSAEPYNIALESLRNI